MRRILASLFVIVAVVGMGVFATGAYFTDTATQTNITFTTGTADLKFQFCPGISTDCLGVNATEDDMDLAGADPANIGPGLANSDCLVFENKGTHPLNLTGGVDTYTQSVGGMSLAFLVKAETTDSSCNPGGTVIFDSSLNSAYLAGHQSFGPLAPGGRLYVIWSNSWNSNGNQNAFQGGTITVDTSMTGQTP